MKTTKEAIITTAVRLFAERGFDAVSTSMIAEQLGITKGALYRHFKNKRGILDGIISRMVKLDAERAGDDHVPQKNYSEDAESYQETSFESFCQFVNHQFVFWTENEFAKNFRRMITLEQYKSPEMMKLYQNVIGSGPVDYSTDLLQEMLRQGCLRQEAENFGAYNLALQLFAPLSLLIQLSDGGMDSEVLKARLAEITKDFEIRWASPKKQHKHKENLP